MTKRSILVVALALANLNAALGGGIMPSLEQMLSLRTRDLLATKWRKAKIEKSISYEGKPIDVFRDVKSSHSCWVKCKRNKNCSRFTYITGKWKKCELYQRGDKQVRKVKQRGAISGYADWRVTVKRWGKEKPGKKQSKNDTSKKKGGTGDGDIAYEAPGFGTDDFDICDLVDCSAVDNIEEAYEDPNAGGGDWNSGFTPSAPDSGGWGAVSDYKLMTGKTIYGRRINSILPCVGNIARRYTDCQSQCNRDGNCDAWTWASFDCSWVGDSRDSGVCYLMTDSDEQDVFQAPEHGDFVSGMKTVGGGGGGSDEQVYEAYEADWSSEGEFNPMVFNAQGVCILNCGFPEGPSDGAYEAPGY